jgi:hypothetical protein
MPRHRIRPVAAKSDHVRIGNETKGARQEAKAQAQTTAPIVSTP